MFGDDLTQRPAGKSRGSKSQNPPSASKRAQKQVTAICGNLLEQLKKITKGKRFMIKSRKMI